MLLSAMSGSWENVLWGPLLICLSSFYPSSPSSFLPAILLAFHSSLLPSSLSLSLLTLSVSILCRYVYHMHGWCLQGDLEVEFQMVVSPSIWVLGTKLGSSARATSAFNHRVILQRLFFSFLLFFFPSFLPFFNSLLFFFFVVVCGTGSHVAQASLWTDAPTCASQVWILQASLPPLAACFQKYCFFFFWWECCWFLSSSYILALTLIRCVIYKCFLLLGSGLRYFFAV